MPIQDFTIFDIPEVIDGLGRCLDGHTLTVCLRVNKFWYQNLLPQLWRDVKVFDFDYNHHEYCTFEAACYRQEAKEEEEEKEKEPKTFTDENGQVWTIVPDDDDPKPRPIRCIQDYSEDLDCHHHADKFSHMIRSITTGSLQSLAALGPGCVNLEYLIHDGYHGIYDNVHFDSSSGIWVWLHDRPRSIQPEVNGIWLGLIERNPGLKVLHMNVITWEDDGGGLQRKILDALKKLPRLEELALEYDLEVPGWIETLEEHCRSLKKLVVNYKQILPRHIEQ